MLHSRPSNEHVGVAGPGSGGEPLCNLAVLSDGSKRLPGITHRQPLGNNASLEAMIGSP